MPKSLPTNLQWNRISLSLLLVTCRLYVFTIYPGFSVTISERLCTFDLIRATIGDGMVIVARMVSRAAAATYGINYKALRSLNDSFNTPSLTLSIFQSCRLTLSSSVGDDGNWGFQERVKGDAGHTGLTRHDTALTSYVGQCTLGASPTELRQLSSTVTSSSHQATLIQMGHLPSLRAPHAHSSSIRLYHSTDAGGVN